MTNRQRPEASDAFLRGALNGDFHGEVLVGRSWWSLEALSDDLVRSELALTVHLAKARAVPISALSGAPATTRRWWSTASTKWARARAAPIFSRIRGVSADFGSAFPGDLVGMPRS